MFLYGYTLQCSVKRSMFSLPGPDSRYIVEYIEQDIHTHNLSSSVIVIISSVEVHVCVLTTHYEIFSNLLVQLIDITYHVDRINPYYN